MEIDKKFIQKIGNKDFILFEGLLAIAHEKGLENVETEVIQIPTKEKPYAVTKAKVTIKGKTYTGIGDASPNSVNRMIVPHLLRMSETRSVARALRFGCNIGMCSFEELGDLDKDTNKTIAAQTIKQSSSKTLENVKVPNVCAGCDSKVSDKVKDYSIKQFGKVLCFDCQKQVKQNSSNNEEPSDDLE